MLLYKKWKKEKYCEELTEQASLYKMARQQERLDERQIDQQLLDKLLMAEMKREERLNLKEFYYHFIQFRY